ncbi:transcription antitermination factor NusB [Diaminobutyricimonas sp. TR449]|uniref:RsmB/NOP family class I SAM-dependent RNA methyltransferase n=1 Tax=Diaminobutyricimonas sp. TR449 TaxID=2708076 RepID=UPI001423B281|nr:transcription antitermination factor NusB [Diaminobutyricimonas sp. TR449]
MNNERSSARRRSDQNRSDQNRADQARTDQSRGQNAGRIQPARQVAYDVIAAVRSSDAYANLLLPVRMQRAALGAADAALATELTYGTLRRMGYYDAVIELAAGRETAKIDPPILDVLRLGAHQLLSMRVAQHAAVDESVSLARQVGSRSATGFVNGVLRTISRSTPDEWLQRATAEASSEDDRLATVHSHPTWVVRALRQALRAENNGDELEELLDADNTPPRVSITALPGLSTVADLAGTTPAPYSPLGAVIGSGDPAGLPAVAAGRARVQDEGSQLAALALSRARPVEPGERWLDLCAGPGGKAALLAAEAKAFGAQLIANEIVPARAQLVRNALAVFDPPIEVWEQDGTSIGVDQPDSFDRILLDAPCTGLGALRRRPEARWRKQPKDVADLGRLQSALLASAVAALKPGGILAYVTCSPHLGETRFIVDDAIKRSGGSLEKLDTAAALAPVTLHPLETPDGSHVQLWPHRHGTDAMFIQLLTKLG